jgi:hypothetical protein
VATLLGFVCALLAKWGNQDGLIVRYGFFGGAIGLAAVVVAFVHQHYDDKDFDELEEHTEQTENSKGSGGMAFT